MIALFFIAATSLRVSVIEDPARPPLSPAEVERILGNASSAYRDRLEPASIDLQVRSRTTLPAFFEGLPADEMEDCLRRFAGNRIEEMSDYDTPTLAPKVASFLSRWPLSALQRAFPAPVRSYDAGARQLIAQMRSDAGPVFAEKSFAAVGHRFSDWACAVELQNSDDVIVTNAFVFYDLAAEPYPHTVFHGTRLSGAAMLSPQRDALFGRAVFVSTYVEGPLSDAFVGTFLLAHELGHALLKVPDVYDHGAGCLMNTSFAPTYAAAYDELLQHRGYCSKCRPYREAHRFVLLLDAALQKTDLHKAEHALEAALHLLPAVVDGDAAAYKSRLLVRIAEPELNANRLRKAEGYAYRATQLDASNDQARLLLRRVRAKLAPPASR